MRHRTSQAVLAGLLVVGLLPVAAQAQYEAWQMGMLSQGQPEGSILGTGSASVKRAPTVLRLHVELFGKGKTLEEALGKLKERREAAQAQLKTLQADPASIVFDSPTMSSLESQRRRQFEAMVMERLRARGRELPKGLKVPKSFTVSASLTAEWPLEAAGAEQMLLAAESIQEKVKAADLAGVKEAEELSPEEEEMAEEMAQMPGYSGQEEVKPGEPCFLYVARISDEDRDKALAEAFAKAKEQASKLAQAAGARLGPLVALAGGGGGRSNYGDDTYGYEYQNYLQRLAGRGDQPGEEDETNEAVATAPGSVAFAFYVRATFRLEK